MLGSAKELVQCLKMTNEENSSFHIGTSTLKLSSKIWSEPEIEKAIDLYVKLPFGRIHSRNPDIVELANQLGRTPSAIALKLSNLASLDETIDRKGMSHASKLDRIVWQNFFEGLQRVSSEIDNFETDNKLAGLREKQQSEYVVPVMAGETTPRTTQSRIGQQFFRQMILASYDYKCAMTGIAQPELLVAGHIRPWSKDKSNRMNPHNGICLNRLHDKAFEEKLISFEADGKILYSNRLKPETRRKMQSIDETGYFQFPKKFKPDLNFLAEHRNEFQLLETSS
ncbi:MAG: HNH endonuclease [Rhodobacteraceae bacterium]|nr:HNH endonuclease [Paracoccaceae bacterium]